MGTELNLDIPRRIAEFETLLNEILPRRIFYKLILRGSGFEFDGYRNFSPDDDASSIDWKASMRSNVLLAKKYIEERKINVTFILDVGENMVFGSQEKLKCEFAAEMAASLAHIFINSGGKVGFVLFNKDDIKVNLPQSGKKQFDIFVSQISDSKNYGEQRDLDLFFENLLERLHPVPELIIFISDFIQVNENHLMDFKYLASFTETIAIMIKDPLDKTLPEINKEIIIEDMNTNQRILINPKIAQKIYEKNALKQINLVKDIFRESNIDFLELGTEEPFSPKLAQFLERRNHRKRTPH